MKMVPVDYIESGAFVGGEEDCYDAGIRIGEKREMVVVFKDELNALIIRSGEKETPSP